MAGLYIHIPFCSQACHYCDFHFSVHRAQADAMVNAIAKEIFLRKEFLETSEIETIYFGGGTPSLLLPSQLDIIFSAISKNFSLQPKAEVTLEANPEDIHEENLKLWQKMGVNRLSIGIQSFQPEILSWMNRVHNVEMAERSVKKAQESGFENITIDLMYGMPNLTEDDWFTNIEKAVKLHVPHISAYQLTIEPKTVFGKKLAQGLLKEPNDDKTELQFDMLVNRLSQAGIFQYEVSNFCKEGHHSKHNSNYWEGVPYLGIGPSAHSFKNFQREINPSSNGQYIQQIELGNWPGKTENLSRKERANEMLLTGLRTIKGANWTKIYNETGIELGQKDKLAKYIRDGLMEIPSEMGELRLTKTGLKLADKLTLELWIE